LRLQITVHTRLDLSKDRQALVDALHDYSSLMNKVERTIHAKLQAGRKWRGDLAVSLYKDFGISANLPSSQRCNFMALLVEMQYGRPEAVTVAGSTCRRRRDAFRNT